MPLVIVGVLLIVLGLAGAMHMSVAGMLDFGIPWFSWAVPVAVLGGLWTQRGRRRVAVVPIAVALALLMNHEQLRLGIWSDLVIGVCGASVLGLRLQARTPEEKAMDRRVFIVAAVAALVALAGLYLLPVVVR